MYTLGNFVETNTLCSPSRYLIAPSREWYTTHASTQEGSTFQLELSRGVALFLPKKQQQGNPFLLLRCPKTISSPNGIGLGRCVTQKTSMETVEFE